MKSDAPRFASFPVSPENVPTKHRAIFSSSFAGLSSHHVQPASMPAMPQRHRHVDDDSLRLIDDLTNRPMDVLYSDSRLATKKTFGGFDLGHQDSGVPHLHRCGCRGKRFRAPAEH